jgi:hypothetical protein
MGHYADRRDRPSEVISALIKTKSRHWCYEREWRQLHILAQCLSGTDFIPPIYYKIISPAAICEVITGCRCDSAKIDELLSAEEFGHVRRRRARVHETDFQARLRKRLIAKCSECTLTKCDRAAISAASI